MRFPIRRRPSPAMVVALIALFVALGGTSFAAITITSGRQIKSGIITSGHVKNRAIKGKDISRKTVKALRGKQGSVGAPGPQGPAGVVGTTIVRRVDYTLNNGQSTANLPAGTGNISCAPGEKPISGGTNFQQIAHGDARLTGSGPRTGTVIDPQVPESGEQWTLWRGTAINPPGGDATPVLVRVMIVCAPA